MLPTLHVSMHDAFPRLTATNYRETSPASWNYSCIAWAAGFNNAWWWPQVGRYWPPNIAREETISSFIAAFAELGFAIAEGAVFELGFEKVALYGVRDKPTHAARQLPNGWWSSKLGPFIDVEHETADDIGGGVYGEVVTILKRNRSN